MCGLETGGTVQPVEVGSDVTRDPRPASLLDALSAFAREYLPSGLCETEEWQRIRRIAWQHDRTLTIAAIALRDEGHRTLAAEAEALLERQVSA